MIKHIEGGVDAILLQDQLEQAPTPKPILFRTSVGAPTIARAGPKLLSAAPKMAHAK